MAATTVTISDDVIERLRQLAEARGVGLQDVIQQVLEETVREAPPIPKSLASDASGHSDTARKASDLHLVPRSWR